MVTFIKSVISKKVHMSTQEVIRHMEDLIKPKPIFPHTIDKQKYDFLLEQLKNVWLKTTQLPLKTSLSLFLL